MNVLERFASVAARVGRMSNRPSTSANTLSQLASNPDMELRMAVADHQNTSLQTIMLLCEDDNMDLRYALAENHNIDLKALNFLAEDENPYVAHRAQQTLARIRPTINFAIDPIIDILRASSISSLSII